MRSEKDKNEYREMLENINSEYHRKEPSNNDFWNKRYHLTPLNNRIDNWGIIIARYEHMVGGEFKEESAEMQTQLIVRVIKEKDRDSELLLKSLVKKLQSSPLQNEDISEYIIKRIKELI